MAHIAGQIGPVADLVEVLVSDNCSTDSTEVVIKARTAAGLKITYLRNASNMGPDNNFVQCYKAAAGKYFWLLGDDDIILDGAIGRVIDIVKNGEYGVLHLNSYGFRKSLEDERPAGNPSGYEVHSNLNAFLGRASYFLTFISSNIINKDLAGADLNFDEFRNTNLIQLCWTFEAVFKGKPNVYVRSYSVAAKADASGGYMLCQVFGKNFLDVCGIYIRKGVEPACFEIIKRRLLLRFFPANIIRARKNILATKPEDYFGALYPLYRRYLYFWIFTMPAIMLPLWPAFMIFKAADWLRKK
ncbi:MAG: glycosyltransferase [Elusimicrobia bacterium]|nr:glycosyltransferase [Elusimicrobiota bacterium]